MSLTYQISTPQKHLSGSIRLDGSKSISNRVLIMEALAGKPFDLQGLSTSADTRTLKKMLHTQEEVLDAGHAGTSFRFSTAFAAVQGKPRVITGSERMKQRPIGPLVGALNELGANIEYLERKGYPPLRVHPSDTRSWARTVTIPSNISSQYISALMMIAPTLPGGLEITLRGEVISKPYIEMTARLMGYFGIEVNWEGATIRIGPGAYQPRPMRIEADWSAASYYFSIAAIAKAAKIRLEGLNADSLQGDQRIIEIMKKMGVSATFESDVLVIEKAGLPNRQRREIDFTDAPDIAQTVAVASAACQFPVVFSGLQTLVIKETDRIQALDNELKKINCRFQSLPEDMHLPRALRRYTVIGKPEWEQPPVFDTYADHRMAMAFAPLALLDPVQVKDPDVVKKSYPMFWEDLASLGLLIEEIG